MKKYKFIITLSDDIEVDSVEKIERTRIMAELFSG